MILPYSLFISFLYQLVTFSIPYPTYLSLSSFILTRKALFCTLLFSFLSISLYYSHFPSSSSSFVSAFLSLYSPLMDIIFYLYVTSQHTFFCSSLYMVIRPLFLSLYFPLLCPSTHLFSYFLLFFSGRLAWVCNEVLEAIIRPSDYLEKSRVLDLRDARSHLK